MMELFHNFVVPILLGLCVTALKIIGDRKEPSFDEANGIALDLVLISVGALGAFYMKGRSAETAFDAGVGNAVIAVILVFIRYG